MSQQDTLIPCVVIHAEPVHRNTIRLAMIFRYRDLNIANWVASLGICQTTDISVYLATRLIIALLAAMVNIATLVIKVSKSSHQEYVLTHVKQDLTMTERSNTAMNAQIPVVLIAQTILASVTSVIARLYI